MSDEDLAQNRIWGPDIIVCSAILEDSDSGTSTHDQHVVCTPVESYMARAFIHEASSDDGVARRGAHDPMVI